MTAYYNEIDRFCCNWLSNLMDAKLITPGRIDDRSIVDVRPDDLAGFERVHFFAGIGGWDYSLNLAGWSDPVWTGSCPCQPFSAAGSGKGFADERHLWPNWLDLIRQRRPAIVFGEQVANARLWFDRVHTDLENLGYAIGAAVLPAVAVDAPHRRDRLWFVADAQRERQPGPREHGSPLHQAADEFREADWLLHAFQKGALPFVCSQHDGVSPSVDGMRGYGNAIVPQVAAEFIGAAMMALSMSSQDGASP